MYNQSNHKKSSQPQQVLPAITSPASHNKSSHNKSITTRVSLAVSIQFAGKTSWPPKLKASWDKDLSLTVYRMYQMLRKIGFVFYGLSCYWTPQSNARGLRFGGAMHIHMAMVIYQSKIMPRLPLYYVRYIHVCHPTCQLCLMRLSIWVVTHWLLCFVVNHAMAAPHIVIYPFWKNGIV